MIDTIEAIDKLNIAIDKLDNAKCSNDTDKLKSGIDDVLDDLRTWKSKKEDELDYIDNSLTWKILNSPPPTIGGKGFLVHEYASHVGANLVFSHYQSAWNNFNK